MSDYPVKELTADAVIENIALITEFTEGLLEENNCPRETLLQIDVVLDEIVSNVAFYAYPQGEIGKVTVRIAIDPEEKNVMISIIDSGKAYNPLDAPDPDITLSAEERKIGGLGVFIVKQTMDEVTYQRQNDQNILTITKAF